MEDGLYCPDHFHFKTASLASCCLHLRHVAKPLLSCDVPQPQAYQRLAVPVENLEGEVYPDGGPAVLGEELVDLALDDAGLAHAEFADDQHLEEVLTGFGHCGGLRPSWSPPAPLTPAGCSRRALPHGPTGFPGGATRPPRAAHQTARPSLTGAGQR